MTKNLHSVSRRTLLYVQSLKDQFMEGCTSLEEVLTFGKEFFPEFQRCIRGNKLLLYESCEGVPDCLS